MKGKYYLLLGLIIMLIGFKFIIFNFDLFKADILFIILTFLLITIGGFIFGFGIAKVKSGE